MSTILVHGDHANGDCSQDSPMVHQSGLRPGVRVTTRECWGDFKVHSSLEVVTNVSAMENF